MQQLVGKRAAEVRLRALLRDRGHRALRDQVREARVDAEQDQQPAQDRDFVAIDPVAGVQVAQIEFSLLVINRAGDIRRGAAVVFVETGVGERDRPRFAPVIDARGASIFLQNHAGPVDRAPQEPAGLGESTLVLRLACKRALLPKRAGDERRRDRDHQHRHDERRALFSPHKASSFT